MMKRFFLLFWLFQLAAFSLNAQDLMDLLDEDEEETSLIEAAFKTTRIINGQSIENPDEGDLIFVISHHFGSINQGAYELWGLDQSTIRLGLEYGFFDRLALGVGRSSYQKTFDGFMKYKLLQQSAGKKAIPVSVSLFSSIALNSLKWEDIERDNYFSSRLAYTHQLLIARKFNPELSFQLTPTVVQKNLVADKSDENDLFALGAGGRFKLSSRVSFNAEYFALLSSSARDEYENSLSLGFDIETGGHVFQLFFTNSNPMFERGFITETQGNWGDGDVFFGFNITRVFTLKNE